MKKYFLIAGVALLLLTGCGKKQVVCTMTEEEGGQKATASIIGELDSSDKITKVSYEMEFSDATYAEQYCALVKLAAPDAKCNGKKIVIDDATSMLEEDDSDKKLVGMTKDEFITYAKSSSSEVTCK